MIFKHRAIFEYFFILIEIHAYDNSAFTNGNNSHEMEERRADSKAEVERMGYEMYNGNKHENR